METTIEKPINVNGEQSGGQLARPPCSHYPPAPDRFEMGDKRMFHWREYNGGKYEVYSIGLMQWAECLDAGRAKAVADALELFYANRELNEPQTEAVNPKTL